MQHIDTDHFSEFLIDLQIWGRWSRGGIPRYKSPLAPDTSEILPINPDYAQRIDSVLAKIKFIFGSYKTACFDLYYIGGLPIAAISKQVDKPRYKVAAEIQEIESLLFFSISGIKETAGTVKDVDNIG